MPHYARGSLPMVPWTMAPSDGPHGAGSGGPGHAQKSKGASLSHALSASAQSDPGPSNPYWSEAWSSPYTTEWPTGPICVHGKQLIVKLKPSLTHACSTTE